MHALQVITAPTLGDVCDLVPRTTPHFGLLLVAPRWPQDTDLVADAIAQLATAGLACLAVWGEGCERIHDIADEVFCAADAAESATDAVVMTTWHDGESLEETIDFFRGAAIPDDAYAETCGTWVVAAVRAEDLAAQVRFLA